MACCCNSPMVPMEAPLPLGRAYSVAHATRHILLSLEAVRYTSGALWFCVVRTLSPSVLGHQAPTPPTQHQGSGPSTWSLTATGIVRTWRTYTIAGSSCGGSTTRAHPRYKLLGRSGAQA